MRKRLGAELEFRRAIELDPNGADLPNYAHILMILGRPDEALQQAERAGAIDPLNPYPRSSYAVVLAFERRYDEALAQANEVLRAQPRYGLAFTVVYVAESESRGCELNRVAAAEGVIPRERSGCPLPGFRPARRPAQPGPPTL